MRRSHIGSIRKYIAVEHWDVHQLWTKKSETLYPLIWAVCSQLPWFLCFQMFKHPQMEGEAGGNTSFRCENRCQIAWSLVVLAQVSSTLNIFTATILQGRQGSNQCFEAKEHVSGFRGQWHSAFLEVAPTSLWDSFPAYSKKSDSITPFSCENILQ